MKAKQKNGSAKKGAGGRPLTYQEAFVAQARKLCEVFPATNVHLAKFFNVTTVTICDWKKKYPEFSNAVRGGKENRDAQVENALYLRAVGGDVTAQMFWLKNRQSDKWRDRREFQGRVEVEDVTPDQFAKATNDELRRIIGTDGIFLLGRQGRETTPMGNGNGHK